VRLNQRAGDNGRLFGSVTSTDVAEAVKAAGGPEVDKRRIQIRNPIKSVGDYTVEIRLHPEVNVSLPIEVVGV
jgi:large subunit ribosomal protein L9